jgi:type II secretory pathway pseudopilin PulG
MRRRCGQRAVAGWSLLELMISLVILVVALLISAPLLYEGQRYIAFESKRALEAESTLALRQIRADVTAADGLLTPPLTVQECFIEVQPSPELPDGTVIRGIDWLGLYLPSRGEITHREVVYDVSAARLLRWMTSSEQSEDVPRKLLDTVVSFCSAPLASSDKSLVLVSLSWQRTLRPGAMARAGKRIIVPTETHAESLILALRGRGGEPGW